MSRYVSLQTFVWCLTVYDRPMTIQSPNRKRLIVARHQMVRAWADMALKSQSDKPEWLPQPVVEATKKYLKLLRA
jgi:hypothetical protein